MAERLMGIETEYAISGQHEWGESFDRNSLVNTLIRIARRNLVHLPDGEAVFIWGMARGSILTTGITRSSARRSVQIHAT